MSNGGLLQDAAGNLYGTTSPYLPEHGKFNYGELYKVSKSGKLTTLHSFNGSDGNGPYAPMFMDTKGNLYGDTGDGGAYGEGVVYKLSKHAKLTVLHSFTESEGSVPQSGIFMDAMGNIYGTTDFGGSYDFGVVWKLSKSGTFTVLYNFTGGADGSFPLAGVTMDAKGNLYGTASAGGSSACEFGCGTVWKLSKSGTLTVLHSFAGGTKDGCDPASTPTMDKQGNLYGTTDTDPETCSSLDAGIVWKVSQNGKETVLHKFAAGSYPDCCVSLDAKGNLYGLTLAGGAHGGGTVFEITSNGKLTTLHNFCSLQNCEDGLAPLGFLILDAEGNLYGTTSAGGSGRSPNCDNGCGTVWKLTR
jgi:uncharacterized repeat protein (TIGR03803 family)